jgi:hypothetical protein
VIIIGDDDVVIFGDDDYIPEREFDVGDFIDSFFPSDAYARFVEDRNRGEIEPITITDEARSEWPRDWDCDLLLGLINEALLDPGLVQCSHDEFLAYIGALVADRPDLDRLPKSFFMRQIAARQRKEQEVQQVELLLDAAGRIAAGQVGRVLGL